MKNVLIISQTNIFSGAEYVLLDYLQHNDAHKFFIYTNNKFINKYNILPKDRCYQSKNMIIMSMFKQPYNFFYTLLNNLYNIHKIVRTHNIEILYGNNSSDLLLTTLYKCYINRKTKIVCHIHDILTEDNRRPLFCLRKYSSYIDHVIVPSAATQKSILKLVPSIKNISMIYNGIDFEKQTILQDRNMTLLKYNIPQDKIVIAIIGSIEQRKRQDLFVEIINYLYAINKDICGLIIGKSLDLEYHSFLSSTIRQKNVPIQIVGEISRDELGDVYQCIDYLILTSERDPLPTVVLEAMSYDKVVISREVDGVKEIITGGQDGYLFAYNETSQNIAHLIQNIIEQKETKYKLISENARKTIAERFNINDKKSKVNKLLEQI